MSEVRRVTRRGQVTIPKSLREEFGIEESMEVEFEATEEGIVLRPKTASVEEVVALAGEMELTDAEFERFLEGRGEEEPGRW